MRIQDVHLTILWATYQCGGQCGRASCIDTQDATFNELKRRLMTDDELRRKLLSELGYAGTPASGKPSAAE